MFESGTICFKTRLLTKRLLVPGVNVTPQINYWACLTPERMGQQLYGKFGTLFQALRGQICVCPSSCERTDCILFFHRSLALGLVAREQGARWLYCCVLRKNYFFYEFLFFTGLAFCFSGFGLANFVPDLYHLYVAHPVYLFFVLTNCLLRVGDEERYARTLPWHPLNRERPGTPMARNRNVWSLYSRAQSFTVRNQLVGLL